MKKNKEKIKIIIFVILSVVSCTQNIKDKPGDIKEIDVISKPDSIIYNLSDIASDILYIPLQTPDVVKFVYIYKMINLQNKVYINTGYNILCYDDSGRFQYSLFENDNESPGFINDFDISSDQKNLAILGYREISIFENQNGAYAFQTSIKLKYPSPCKISFIPETLNMMLSIYPIKGIEKTLSLIIDSYGDTVQLKKNSKKYIQSSMPITETRTIQYKSGNKVFFKEQNNDTVFYITGKSLIEPSYILDLKERTLLNWVKKSGEYQYNKKNPYYVVESIFEVPKFILYTYSQNFPDQKYSLQHRIIYNKITGKKVHAPFHQDLKNDICGGPDFYPLFVSGDKYYSWTYGMDLKNYINSEIFNDAKIQNPDRKQTFADLIGKLQDRDIVLVVALPK
jgi:hypothetical protein